MANNVINSYKDIIAIVSGKGGSGKTMITAAIAQLIGSKEKKVLVVDTDFATAGLTYYMGLKTVRNISVGLTNLVSSNNESESVPIDRIIQKMKGFENSYFVGVGDHRRFYKKYDASAIDLILSEFINETINDFDYVILDCRGGIDSESLSVCKLVNSILLVVETDTTSFQATQHLVDVLYDNDLSDKLSGFIINKVFDDPKAIAMNGTAAFKSQYLGSIPFDLEATRSFLIGETPSKNSYFSSQVSYVIENLIENYHNKTNRRKMDFNDFKGLNIRDTDSLIGGVILSFSAISFGIPTILSFYGYTELRNVDTQMFIFILMIIGISAGIEPLRRSVGMVFSVYARIVRKLLTKL